MEAKRQTEIDGGGIADGKGIVPVDYTARLTHLWSVED
jgi:hypothetical protein